MEDKNKGFEEAEIQLLKESLNRTYKERFEMGTRLYKVYKTLQKAKITYKPFIDK